MGNISNLVDIESYCNELSSITGISIETIRIIVIENFARVCFSDGISFIDATANIERELDRLLAKPKIKVVASKSLNKNYAEEIESEIYQALVSDKKVLQVAL